MSRLSPGAASFKAGSVRSRWVFVSPIETRNSFSPAGPPKLASSKFAAVLSLSVMAALHSLPSVIPLAPANHLMSAIATVSLGCLICLGAWSAQVGGADPRIGALRVTFWSALAMAVTAGVGSLVGAS